ncbi:Beta-ketoacyl synthase protein, partial [Ostertagia ostertagi]
MLGQGADRIHLQLTIGTTTGQTAIAPGYLLKKWEQDGRSYFEYQMDQPAVNYFSIQSGRYQVLRESFQPDSAQQPVQLSVYYHKDHAYNIGLMMTGMKDALSYFGSNFSPYQYRQLRIIEFPSSSFAQSFANTIPFSENIGFLADLRDTTASKLSRSPVDYVYYVTAHEVAHQWWAHQILPANTEGANFLCETMAQYSALMLMKHKYGEQRVRQFLEMESYNYLSGRGSESKEERPLANVLMEQQYIFYNKGACAMYALQHYLGEERMNQVIKEYIRDNAFRERPYVTANDFVSRIKNAAPDSMKYLGMKPEEIDDNAALFGDGLGLDSIDSLELMVLLEPEGKAIQDIWNGQPPPFSATKPFTGHTLAAAGAIEAIFSILAMQHSFVPANLNFSTPMEELSIRPAATVIEQRDMHHVVSNSFGFGEPDYRPFINPVAIRRMSRLMKMAISAAVQCINEAELMAPDAIITGTGRGSMTDTEHFLNDMIRLEEGAMNPTSFIQSTYNSPNGWIAMLLKCTAYNQTYVHRGSSLELALLDAQLILAEGGEDTRNVLAGSYDELTDDYFLVKGKINYWKDIIPPSLELLQHTDTA